MTSTRPTTAPRTEELAPDRYRVVNETIGLISEQPLTRAEAIELATHNNAYSPPDVGRWLAVETVPIPLPELPTA